MRKKDIMRPLVFQKIVEHFKWSGAKMLFPYTLNGESKYSEITLAMLYIKQLNGRIN